MALLTASFGVRLQGLKSLRDGRRQSSQLKRAVDLIEKDLSGFILKRYDIFSKGGGSWPPIAESTARRKGNRRILYETGDLRSGLALGLYTRVSWSGSWMTMTFRLRARRVHRPSGLPIQTLIDIHQRGLGRVPRRAVLVRPDAAAKRKVSKRLSTAIKARN